MTYLQLFWVFFKTSLISFGGVMAVLPYLEKAVVHDHGWLTQAQFLRAYAFCQFVPGPNMALGPLIGYWVAGIPGFLSAFLGIYTSPIILFGIVARVYKRTKKVERLRFFELAMRPLVLGLVIAAALQYWWFQSQGLVDSIPLSRIIAALITLVGLFAYQKRKVGALTLLSITALVWYGVHTASHFM